MGQALLHGARDRWLWLAGRAKIDDWGSRPRPNCISRMPPGRD
jgi:single-stranded-DNA-specific exonuclease